MTLWCRSALPLLLLAASAAAQDRGLLPVTPPSPTTPDTTLYQGSYAVVVGVSEYEAWPDLPGAVADAQQVVQALEALGFSVRLVTDADRAALEAELGNLEFATGREEARVLFYFAGHGETEVLANGEELGYLVPRDAPLQSVDPRGFVDRAVSLERIEQCAKRMRCRHALFVFDSCFAGTIFSQERAAPQNVTDGCRLPVRQFVTAGGRSETVPDASLFRACFLRALAGEADLTRDGYVTGTELGVYLQEQVTNYSRGAQHPQAGKLRDPALDQGEFVFALPGAPPLPAAPPVPPVVAAAPLAEQVAGAAQAPAVPSQATAAPVPQLLDVERGPLPGPPRRTSYSAFSELCGVGLMVAGGDRVYRLTLFDRGYANRIGPLGVEAGLVEALLHHAEQSGDLPPSQRLQEYDKIVTAVPVGVFLPLTDDGPLVTLFARAAVVSVIRHSQGSSGDDEGLFPPVLRWGVEWRSTLYSAWAGYCRQSRPYHRGARWPSDVYLTGLAAEMHVGLGSTR